MNKNNNESNTSACFEIKLPQHPVPLNLHLFSQAYDALIFPYDTRLPDVFFPFCKSAGYCHS
jgi:hypothetical protein